MTLFGLPVGEVTDVGLSFDPATRRFRPRVLITFFPDSSSRPGARQQTAAQGAQGGTDEARLRMLRAASRSGGCVRSCRPAASSPANSTSRSSMFRMRRSPRSTGADPLELPWCPADLPHLEAKLTSILTKVDNMPLDAIGIDVKNALATLDQTLKDAGHACQRRRHAAGARGNQDARGRCGERLPPPTAAIKNADSTLFGKDSPAPQDLRDTLKEVAARGACGARPRRLSRAPPRSPDPGQAGGEA